MPRPTKSRHWNRAPPPPATPLATLAPDERLTSRVVAAYLGMTRRQLEGRHRRQSPYAPPLHRDAEGRLYCFAAELLAFVAAVPHYGVRYPHRLEPKARAGGRQRGREAEAVPEGPLESLPPDMLLGTVSVAHFSGRTMQAVMARRLRHPASRLLEVPGGDHRSAQHDPALHAASLTWLADVTS